MGLISSIKSESRSARYNEGQHVALGAGWLGTGSRSASGIIVDEETAFSISAFWCGVNAISSDIAKLPFGVYLREGEARRELDMDPVAMLMSRQPNPETTAFAWRKLKVMYALAWGNAVSEIEWAGNGRPIALWQQHPRDVNITREKTGRKRLVYEINSERHGRTVSLYSDEVFHLFGPSFDGVQGVSVVKYARESMAVAVASDRFSSGFFAGGAAPLGILKHKGKLADGGKRIRESWEELHKGPKRRVGVLEEGMDYQQIGMSQEDAQFLETKQFSIAEVARWLRMTPHKLMDLTHGTFSNIEHQSIEYVGDCLGQWIAPFEQEADRKFFGVKDARYCRHNVAGLLRGDTKSRFEAYNVGRLGGWLCVDDILALEDRNPLPDGQGKVYLSPANMIPADRLEEMTDAQIEGKLAPSIKFSSPESNPPPPPANPTNGVQNRMLLAQKPVLAEAFSRVLRVEADRVKRSAKRADFAAWSATFYQEHRDHVRGALFAFAETFAAMAAEAGLTGIEAPTLALELADRHIADSRSRLGAATDVAAEVDGWESRAETAAAAELARILAPLTREKP
jgi:HK97 family phage portal protein